MDKKIKKLRNRNIHKKQKSKAAAALLVFMLAAATPVWATATGTAGTQAPQSTLSKDNSLKSLSLSEGTLSPEFQGSTVNYTATVGADVTSVEVNAERSNSNAVIDSITGNTDLQPGENTIKITVTSQAGTTAVYTIVLTKSEDALGAAQDGQQEEGTDGEETPSAVINSDGTVTIAGTTYPVRDNRMESQSPEGHLYPEATYEALEKKYESLKKQFMICIAVAAVVLIVLIIALIVTKRKAQDWDDDFDEWDLGMAEDKKEKKKEVKKEPKKKAAVPAGQEPKKQEKKSWDDELDWEDDDDWDDDDWDDKSVFRKKAVKEPARKKASAGQEKAKAAKKTSQNRTDGQTVKKTTASPVKGQTGRVTPPAGHNDGDTKQTPVKKKLDEEALWKDKESDVEIMDLNDL